MPTFRPWEILLAALALVPAGILVVQRALLFGDLKYGVFDGDVVVLFLWMLLVSVILLATKPWVKRSKLGGPVRIIASVLALVSAFLMAFWGSGFGRAWMVKFEATVANLGVTSYQEGLRTDLTLELVDPKIGPHLITDKGFLCRLVGKAEENLADSPRAARVVLSTLKAKGMTWSEIVALPNAQNLVLGALLAEADPQPWHRLDWVPQPELAPSPELGLNTELLSEQEGREVLALAFEGLEQMGTAQMERLLMAVMSFPTLTTEDQREGLFKRWAGSFEDLEELAVDGLVIRQQVREFLGPREEVSVNLHLEGGTPSGSTYRHVPETLPRMILGLIHSCGVKTKQTQTGELEITVHLSEISHHSYSRPTYKYETYYETTTSGYSRPGLIRSRQVKRERQVVSGHEEMTVFVPVASIELRLGEQVLNLDRELLHWHNLRYDYENKRFMDLDKEEVYGRMWPLGLHEKNFVFPYMTDIY